MIDMFVLWEKFVGSVNMPQGGAIKPNRQFEHWVNDISISMYEEKFLAWERDQKIIDDMSRPFLKSVNIAVKDIAGANYGALKFPPDYGHFSSVSYYVNAQGKPVPIEGKEICDCTGKKYEAKECPDFIDDELWEIFKSQEEAKEEQEEKPTGYIERQVEKVTDSRWAALMEHRFLKPTKERPKVTDSDNGLKVAPLGVGMLVLNYLKKPAPAKFVYKTTPGNPQTGEGDVLEYDKDKSVPLEWSELVINEFVERLGKKYGKYVSSQFIYETSEADRQKTV